MTTNPRDIVTIGCDVGGTAVKLVRLRGERVEESRRIPTPSTARAFVHVVAAEIAALGRGRGRSGRGRRPPSAVGVALPGFLDATRSVVLRLSNLPFLDGRPLGRLLEAEVGLPVILDADTNAGAVAEARLGAGRGADRILYLTLGTGLGAAMAVGGAPVRVSRHTVGQVAHVPLDPGGPRCRCGDRGCAEATLREAGIVWRARRLGLRDVRTTEELAGVARSSRRGDRRGSAARRVWREVGTLAGRLALILTSLVSPEVIVFGGGVSGAADLFLPAVRSALDRGALRRLGRPVDVLPAAGGLFSGAIGAALLARSEDPRAT